MVYSQAGWGFHCHLGSFTTQCFDSKIDPRFGQTQNDCIGHPTEGVVRTKSPCQQPCCLPDYFTAQAGTAASSPPSQGGESASRVAVSELEVVDFESEFASTANV